MTYKFKVLIAGEFGISEKSVDLTLRPSLPKHMG